MWVNDGPLSAETPVHRPDDIVTPAQLALHSQLRRGGQWAHGAVACSEWVGVLEAASLRSTVVYSVHEGADTRETGDFG